MHKIRNNKELFIKLVLLKAILFSSLNYAQTDNSDWASWNTIGIDYKLNEKWSFALEQQLRLKENFGIVDRFITELSAANELFKDFELGVGLRYMKVSNNKDNLQVYENYFRFHFETIYKHKIKNYEIRYRLRYQNKNELGVSYEEGDYASKYIRFRTSLKYNFKNWILDPKFSAEIFNKSQKGKKNGLNRYRLTLGTDYKIKNFGKLGVFYRFQKELNKENPETTNIMGLKYIYSINN